MEQKKCLNCLCMSDMDVKVCPYCKTPFSSGRISPVPLSDTFRKKFNPPPLVTDEQKRSAKITRNIQTAILNTDKNEPEASVITISDLIKNRAQKYSAFLVTKDPYVYAPFTIDSLEIEEIKPEEKTEEKIVIDGVNVDPEQLRELADLARELSPSLPDAAPEVKVEQQEEKKVFEHRKVIRTSDEEIIQKNPAEDTNLGIRQVVEALEAVAITEPEKPEAAKQTEEEPKKTETTEQKEAEPEKTEAALTEPEKPAVNQETEKEPDQTALVRSSEHLKIHEAARENQRETASMENTLNTRAQTSARGTTNNKALEHYSTARMLCVQGNYAKALEELELSVKLDPAYEQAHILLSRTYLKLKNG